MTTRISGRGAHFASERSPAYFSGPCRARRAAITGSSERLEIARPRESSASSADDDRRTDEEEGRATGVAPRRFGAAHDRGGRDGADHGTDDTAPDADPAVDEHPRDDTDDDGTEQRRCKSEPEPGEHAGKRDPGGNADSDGDSDLVPVAHLGRSLGMFYRQPVGETAQPLPGQVTATTGLRGKRAYGCEAPLQCTDRPLEAADHIEAERPCTHAVDDAMVEGDRHVPHLADDDLAVPHDRPRPDPVEPENRDLRMVDQRRHEEAAELSGARDGEGRVAQVVGMQRAGPRPIGESSDLGIDLGDREPVAAVDDGHDEPCLGVDGDPEVVAVEQDDVVTLDARVQLGILDERGGDGSKRGGDEQCRDRRP